MHRSVVMLAVKIMYLHEMESNDHVTCTDDIGHQLGNFQKINLNCLLTRSSSRRICGKHVGMHSSALMLTVKITYLHEMESNDHVTCTDDIGHQ